jgi:DndB-like DNA-sulfur modification-associated protein
MNSIENNSTPDTNLAQLLQGGDASDRPFTTLPGNNMGNTTLCLCVPMHQFWEISEVANERNLAEKPGFAGHAIAQRRLDEKHAQKLATYILKGLFNTLEQRALGEGKELGEKFEEMHRALGKQPYLALQPITANIRECAPGGRDLRVSQPTPESKLVVHLSQKHVLWVVDGQHRREAMRLVFDFFRTVLQLHKYPKGSLYPAADRGQEVSPEELNIWIQAYEAARTHCKILVEAHLGLNADQERQLFHDLNNLTKKVESSLAFQFDNSNPINLFIKEELIDDGILEAKVVDQDMVDWNSDPGAISRKDLIAVNALLFLNKTNINGAKPADVDEKKEVARKFWERVSQIPNFGVDQAKKLTVAAQPVVLKALAKIAYTYGCGRQADPVVLNKFLSGLAKVDFAHSNPMWRYYSLSISERSSLCDGLANYLPAEEGGANRDIGGFNDVDKVMRFGAKHNDIYPILGDMIRWQSGLPSRRESDAE